MKNQHSVSGENDIEQAGELLTTARKTLSICLSQLAKIGSAYAPPGLLHQIDESRKTIRDCKARLRTWGVEVPDHPDDEAGRRFSLIGSGAEVLERAQYRHYVLPRMFRPTLDLILSTPDYYLIASEIGTGKTALIAHLWDEAQRSGRITAIHVFNRDYGSTSIVRAIASLDYQLRDSIRLRYPDVSRQLDQTFSLRGLLQLTADCGGRPLLLIDAFDETDRLDRQSALLRQLLPDLDAYGPGGKPADDITIVVTTRPDARRNLLKHLPGGHPLRVRISPRSLPQFGETDVVELLRRHAHLSDPGPIARRIAELTGGYPLGVSALCRQVGQAPDDPASVLTDINELRTIKDVWRGTLEQIEHDCGNHSYDLLRRLLAVTAVARSGLNLAELQHLLNEPGDRLEPLIQGLQRYLYADGEDGFVLVHHHFRRFFCDHSNYKDTAQRLDSG